MSWNQVTMDRFNAFLGECSRIRVSHALNYNACNNLFVNNQVNDNMYLLQENRTHCWIKSNSAFAIADKLEEGHAYIISRFSVEAINLKFRCFEGDVHVLLHKQTIITPLQSNVSGIPQDIFKFTNLSKLADYADDDSCLVDVVGIVENLRPYQTIDGPRDEKHFYKEFYLSDLIFWDGFAMHFEKKYNEGNSNPRIITISSCKILKNQYTGELTIRNVQPTRLFVNFKTGKEDSIMKRLWEINGFE
ncbi:hypothetical protein ACET3Z_018811 [Daucus carota]